MPLTIVIIVIHLVFSLFTLHRTNTKNVAYHIAEVLIFYADKFLVMGSSKNTRVFNFAILLKSRKFDVHKNILCFTVYHLGDIFRAVHGLVICECYPNDSLN